MMVEGLPRGVPAAFARLPFSHRTGRPMAQ
jgi:hypothetical protein